MFINILIAVGSFGLIALLAAVVLSYVSLKFKVEGDPVVDKIDALLPQTQCGQCTYPGCRPYAEAIAAGKANINQCPPGGEQTMLNLADLLDVEPIPLDAEDDPTPMVAIIREDECIGCTLCIQACPVDAILGTSKQMHTVIESECTGCELCLPPCPVDCIDMVTITPKYNTWVWPHPHKVAQV